MKRKRMYPHLDYKDILVWQTTVVATAARYGLKVEYLSICERNFTIIVCAAPKTTLCDMVRDSLSSFARAYNFRHTRSGTLFSGMKMSCETYCPAISVIPKSQSGEFSREFILGRNLVIRRRIKRQNLSYRHLDVILGRLSADEQKLMARHIVETYQRSIQ